MAGSLPLKEVLATGQLALRPRLEKDPALLADASQALAAARPLGHDALLATLAAHARLLCGAHSAGVSMFASHKCDDLSWASVSGILAPFEGRRFPLRHSMCGVCMEQRAPQLFLCPHSYFSRMALNGIALRESLVVPLGDAGNAIYGTLWLAAHDASASFSLADRDVLLALGAYATAALRAQAPA
ncbi:MAG: GAF domain-containing protein [Pseudomonadota bacterium]